MYRPVGALVAAASLIALGAVRPVHAAVHVDATVSIPTAASVSATAEGCTNNPGPFITLSGELRLGGLSARLIFRNNEKGTHTHTEDVTLDVVLIPAGESITFAKQPLEGGVGGNPFIFLQFTDAAGNAISNEVLLGRCVQGLDTTTVGLPLPFGGSVDVSAGSCTNNPGPFITLSGELTLGGINARLIFRNNLKDTHTHTEDIDDGGVSDSAGDNQRSVTRKESEP